MWCVSKAALTGELVLQIEWRWLRCLAGSGPAGAASHFAASHLAALRAAACTRPACAASDRATVACAVQFVPGFRRQECPAYA